MPGGNDHCFKIDEGKVKVFKLKELNENIL